ncbi:MAG: ABC transporter permease, partial [Chloroflexi bacterium]
MQQYIARRMLLNVLVLLLVASMVFLALRIDSSNVVGQRAQGCTVGDYEECQKVAKQELGLDSPLYKQYFNFMSDIVRLDFGDSWRQKTPVLDEIRSRAAPSIELGLLQIVVALTVALPIGIISAIRQDSWIDYLLRFFSIALLGIPVFVLAILIILVTSRYASGSFLPDWLGPHSATSYANIWEDPWRNIKIMCGPALIGGLGTGAVIMRFLRSQMLEVLRQDYVRTAWAKGLKERVIVVRHALKNALIPVLTVVGILLGSIVSGNVVLETVYAVPGIGYYVTTAVSQNATDFPV